MYSIYSMNHDKITLCTWWDGRQGEANNSSTILRGEIMKIKTKRELIEYLLKKGCCPKSIMNEFLAGEFDIFRKSKKKKNWVRLEDSKDFEEFRRSLKVKSTFKLRVMKMADSKLVNPSSRQAMKGLQDLERSEIWEQIYTLVNIYQALSSSDSDRATRRPLDSKPTDLTPNELITHESIACNSCNPSLNFVDIAGPRYKCTVCDNFDLCEKCFKQGYSNEHHNELHPILALRTAASVSLLNMTPFASSQDIRIDSQTNSSVLGAEKAELMNERDEDLTRLSDLLALVSKEHPSKLQRVKSILKREFGEESHSAISREATISVVPKGKNLCQVHIKNESFGAIFFGRFRIEFINCCGKAVSSSDINFTKDLNPGQTAKLNVIVNLTHLKHPFQLNIRGETYDCSCNMTLNSLVTTTTLWPVGNQIDSKTRRHEQFSSGLDCLGRNPWQALSQLMPSMIAETDRCFPCSPRASECDQKIDLEEDFDLLSIDDLNDSASEFEILSRTDSCQ